MKVTLVTILLLPFVFAYYDQKSENRIITNLILEVMRKFYKTQTSTLNFLLLINDEKLKFEVEELVNELLKNVDQEIAIAVEDNENTKYAVQKKFCVIFVDSFESFNKINPNLHFHFSGFYTIILMSKNKELEMKKIFELFWSHQIVNVNILQNKNSKIVNFHTFHPYISKHCGQVQMIKINSFNEIKLKNSRIFPNKMKNLHGCKLKVSVIESPPYVMRKFDIKKITDAFGLDLYIILNHALLMNFSLEILYLNKANETDKASGIFDATGVALSNLIKGNTNFTAGLMIQSEVKNKISTPGYSYHTTKVVWVIPTGQPLTVWEIFTRPFQNSVWIFILSTYIATRIIIFLIWTKGSKKVKNFVFGRDIRYPFTNLIIILFGMSLHKLPGRNFA
ncbi:hypothetical protein PVAND_014643 [Polypedilum vanderplanki]|uniref:Putative ionotropic receptor ligand binding domain-containing protein n=1 Tax=Polypedilum vanderplanki TaxID=319348 RepID=A0A9J6BAS9_POLVA|nr:hypothetical protein PVAND_014643 [Polypedilum vanderplanki]